ncbi:hypothetical protein HL653_22755 [Sphingomonas sp. AP4-R1]|uniref:hypothetical protein n=1 Tax=Sphingomonas sp. AP4-R1 TaxID=2735134 RepID=UPI001493D7B2|nr:hypothetical protein [Sphingomonas sp. AP4-R1]QJU60182.1 hypothetical protein HL653_22755 [Sphingomonas sp. AP4-R1]
MIKLPWSTELRNCRVSELMLTAGRAAIAFLRELRMDVTDDANGSAKFRYYCLGELKAAQTSLSGRS